MEIFNSNQNAHLIKAIKIDRKVDLTCSEIHNGKNEGTIHNRRYEDYDSGDRICNYQISVPSNNQVALSFPEFESWYNNVLIFVFDGPDCTSNWIGYLRHPLNEPLIASGNSITALLTVQRAVDTWRFKGNYSTVSGMNASTPLTQVPCGEDFNRPKFRFSARFQAAYPQVCVWRITVTPGRKVQLFFDTLSFSSSRSRLRVLDGTTCGGTILSEFSQYSGIPQNGIISNSNTMMLVYTDPVIESLSTSIDFSFSENCLPFYLLHFHLSQFSIRRCQFNCAINIERPAHII
ncbi:unnamed protein product [Dicrocoelium dendriticum]|nr:unnamed protein product [Dicrocoelium dendriticum]